MGSGLAQLLLLKGTDSDHLPLRRWFLLFLGYLAGLTALVLASVPLADQPGLAGRFWLLPLYVFYLSLCCTFFPAPTSWIILLMASPVAGLFPADTMTGAVATVLTVAILGAFGTMMANLNEYHLFTWLLRIGRVSRVRQTRFYQRAARWFESSPMLILTLFSLLPIPVDVVRWLAITHRYPRGRYAAAYFIGRFIRYAALAATAYHFAIGWQGIALIQGGLIAVVLLRLAVRRLNNPYSADVTSSEHSDKQEEPPLEAPDDPSATTADQADH